MTDVLKMSRKALTMGVVLTTILWSMMATVLVAPLKASAAGCTSGSLIKGSLAAVYYCGADGKRYVFTNDKAYFTWYSNFSGVMTISDADLASIQIGGNVTYRPGVKMLKIQSDPKVYAIGKGGVLRPIASEAVAIALYGSTWNKQIDDVSDAFFTNYTVGNPINAASDYDKNAEMSSSQTVNQDKNLASGPGSLSGVTVSLASDSPASATVPKSATGVNFVKFNVMNGSGSSGMVDSITLHRVGAGASTDFSNVYLYEGNTRLTTGRSVNSSTNDVTFNSLGLNLTAGQTRTLWVAATMSSTAGAGNVNAFQVTSVMSGTANAVGLPIQGNTMTNASATVGVITISKTGSLTNPKVGQMNVKLAEFQLSAGSAEDLDIKRITLFQSGNISRSNLTNLRLRAGGVDVASAASVDEKDRVTFVLTGTTLLEKGNTRTYEVWGDIGGGARSADTIKLATEEDTDVWAAGRTFGYGASVVRTAYDNSSNDGTDASWTTVEGGQITITFNGPAAADIATNGKDKQVLNFTLASQSNVEVRNLRLRITATGIDAAGGLYNSTDSVANYTDIKVIDTASSVIIAGPKDVDNSNDTTQNLVYTDVFTLSAGQTRTFKVTLDVANQSALDSDSVRVDLVAFGSSDIRNLDNSTYVDASTIVPSSTISGNAMTVRTPSLTVSTASTPVAQTFIQGSQNVALAGVSLKAGQAADVKVTAMTVQMRVDSDNNAGFFNGCENNADTGATDKFATDILLSAKLMNGATQVGDIKSPTSSTANCTTSDGGLLQFTNLNLTVPAGQTITLSVVGTLAGSISNLNDTIDFTVASAAVTAQDMDGNTITPSGSSNSADMIISSSGSMTIVLAPDDTESEAGLVLGGTTAVLAKYRFTAQAEDLNVTRLTFLAENIGSPIDTLSLYDGAALVAGPTSLGGNGVATFSNISFLVPKNTSKTLTLKGGLNNVGPSGAASGSTIILYLCDDNSTCPGTGEFEARGTSVGSQTLLTDFNSVGIDDSFLSREKIIRKTKPTVTSVALPTSTLSNGTQVISRFTITADAAQQVSFKSAAFELNLNNVSGSALRVTSPAIREVGQGSDLSASTTAAVLNCSGSAVCSFPMTLSNEQTIAAGTSKTYELRATIAGADASGESISTKLLGDTAQVTGELDTIAGINANNGIQDFDGADNSGPFNFIWSDNSAIPHSDTTGSNFGADEVGSNDWTNGRFVKLLPSDAQTMTRS